VKRHDFKMMKAAVFPLVLSLAVLLPGIGVEAADPNVFNRLMKPPSMRNPPPAKDGIHDPPAATLLQPPKDSFGQLPKGTSGNYVDWVKALEAGADEVVNWENDEYLEVKYLCIGGI